MKQNIGKEGEKLAEEFLKKRGYRILARNYFFCSLTGKKKGEIDIIAKKGNSFVFVEVKSISQRNPHFFPEAKINFSKKRKIILAAEKWLKENKISLRSPWRIDIVAIFNLAHSPQILHFENAIADFR